MKKFAVIESMHKWSTKYYDIRVWRNEDNIDDQTYLDDEPFCPQDIVNVCIKFDKSQKLKRLIHKLASLPNVNAVEVINKFTKCGYVVYTTWP